MQESDTKASTFVKYRKGSSVAEVCEGLRWRILTLELRPGEPIDETQLSELFGVSRSPVRKAIYWLLAERLVVPLPNRGAILAPVDLMGFPQFMEALDVQQRHTSRLASRHRSSADWVRLEICAAEYNEAVRAIQANYEFHMAVGEAGRNDYVARQYSELFSEARRSLHIHIEYLVAT